MTSGCVCVWCVAMHSPRMPESGFALSPIKWDSIFCYFGSVVTVVWEYMVNSEENQEGLRLWRVCRWPVWLVSPGCMSELG